MSLDPPTYLNSLQNNIRARPIPWEGAVRAGTITDNDLKRIKAVDKVRKEQRKQTVEADTEVYRSLLLGGSQGKSVLESAAKRADVVQYMLVLSGDLINDAPTLTPALLEHPDPYKPFLPLLSHSNNPEDPIPLLTSSVLSTLLSSAQVQFPKSNPQLDVALPKMYKYLSTLTKSQDNGLQDIAVQECSTLLRTKKARELFWKQREETVNPLIDILRAAAGSGRDTDSTMFSGATSIRSATEAGLSGGVGIQLLYHVLLTIWQLSFEGSLIGQGLEREQEIIALYSHLLRLSPKEKTTRLLISTLLNLLSPSPNRSILLPLATSARLPALLQNVKGRHLTDPDLLEDLEALSSLLDEYTSSQTTFDEYAAEVLNGHLRWSPPHRDGDFWRENARKILDENQGELPKALQQMLNKAWEDDKNVLAIACNDVGWLVKEAPEKRSQLEKLGIKARVMELMTDRDEAVRWESLRAVGEWLRHMMLYSAYKLVLSHLVLALAMSTAESLQAGLAHRDLPLSLIPSNSSALAIPTPPLGFKIYPEIDVTIQLKPLEVYETAILMMSWLSTSHRWIDTIDISVTISEATYTTGCSISPISKTHPLSAELAVQGLYAAGISIVEKNAFYKYRAAIFIGEEFYGVIKFFPRKPKKQRSLSPPADPGRANTTDLLATEYRGFVVDPGDPSFVIRYIFSGNKIGAGDVFTALLNAFAITAQHDSNDLNAFVPAAPSAAGDVLGNVVISTWPLAPKDNPDMSWGHLKRAFLLIWKKMIIDGPGTGRPRFEEFEFGLEYNGAKIGAGVLWKIDKANNSTIGTAVAKRRRSSNGRV